MHWDAINLQHGSDFSSIRSGEEIDIVNKNHCQVRYIDPDFDLYLFKAA